MRRLVRSASLVMVLLLAGLDTAAAGCECVRLRTFTPEEQAQFETRHGLNWWRTLGLIPGPATPGDYVERPFGDSSRQVFIPQQFWDLRACVDGTDRLDPGAPKRGGADGGR